MKKRIAILQSSYIPWKGYFDIIGSVDEFVLYDDVQYTVRDWRNRNRIKTLQGPMWLSIPIINVSQQKIREARVADQKWRKRHWSSIARSYARAPFFDAYREIFEDLYLAGSEEYLSRINYGFIAAVNRIMGISTRLTWSHDFRLTEGKTERLVNICKQAGATEYVSGPAAKAYIDEKLFEKENISISWMDYSGYPEYRQVYPPFEHAVSILDLLFCEGPRSAEFMKWKRPS